MGGRVVRLGSKTRKISGKVIVRRGLPSHPGAAVISGSWHTRLQT